MKPHLALSIFALLCGCGGQSDKPAPASSVGAVLPEGAWNVNYAESRLGFSATQNKREFQGEFEKFTAVIVFDPADLSNASIDAAIDMSSAKTGDKQRDTALPTSDWFKTRDFPAARFISADVEKTGEGTYVAHGSLTIRDATRDIDLPFTLAIDGDRARAVGETTLARTDYGVGQGEFATDEWVGVEVKVTVDVAATR